MKIENLTIKKASEILKSGETTSVKLTEYYLDRIKELNPKLNAFITVFDEEAILMAKASDERRAKNNILSDIDGVPIAIKDNICIDNTKITAASKILENFVAPYDATVISKLKDAGAVILGKTNMDEFAMGSSTETSYFGPTKNPYDIERVPGGSSGGSAAAVAADLCVAALGSDTGGSIRQPASFCGIVGLKPTYGTVSRYGLLAMASSLDQIGPMTKTAEDAKTIYNIIEGHDIKDSTSVNSKLKMSNVKQNQKSKIKIGIPREYFTEGLDQEVKKIIENSIENLKKQGAEIKEISLPNQKYALSTYYITVFVEVASNLARYDGIKYGLSAKDAQNLLDTYFKSRSEGLGEEVKRRIILGTYASSAGYVDQYYNKAQKTRALIRKDFDQVFNEVDFILGPVFPTPAFKIGEKISDPLAMYLSDIYTIAVNLAGLPAISVPAGFIGPNQENRTSDVRLNGLPVGLQIIGPQFSDLEILSLGKSLEKEQDGPPPIN